MEKKFEQNYIDVPVRVTIKPAERTFDVDIKVAYIEVGGSVENDKVVLEFNNEQFVLGKGETLNLSFKP